MNAFLVCVARWMLTTFWVFGALQQSESAIDCRVKPDNPKIVVLGVDSKEVSLNWKNCDGDAGETIRSFAFLRQRPDSAITERIASRDASGSFNMIGPFKDKKKYEALLNQELKIFDVKKSEEYIYTLEIDYRASGGELLEEAFRVTVDVKEPPEITISPIREVQLNLGQNYTLKCNASGDPHPNINWTKDGVPASQFNASGYLHLVNVQREDAGSYICTASNGFGDNDTATSIINIKCSDCKTERVGIRIKELTFKQSFGNQLSSEFKNLESSLLSAIWAAFADNPGKQLHRVDVEEFSDGSVYAIVELAFGPSVSDPLKPLRDEINDGKLGSFTVDRQLDVNPTSPPTTKSTETTTGSPGGSPSTGARESGLTDAELGGIIAGCVCVLLLTVAIIVFCICKQRRKNSGASKGSKYSEEDGYRMNRQPPPSGLGTASPAYVEARQYAPVTAARRQDDQSKPPLNYADLSFDNSSGPNRMPPPYSGTEYSEMSPEKRAKPAGGQQGEGGGFELWC